MLKISNISIIIIFTFVVGVMTIMSSEVIDLWNSSDFSITINTTMTVNNDVSTTMEYNKIHLPISNTSTGLFSSL